ncbi:MAG: hypothetical protein FWC72_04720 [Oscillospiraceae bacterium]|nr:hypothetical protein [Oscillospiraceae bacterium]
MLQSESKKRHIELAKKQGGVLGKLNKGNLVKLIFPKLATMAINLVQIGPRVILRSAFQILRTNIWTRLISTFLLVSIDLFHFFRKKISKKQLLINLLLSATLLAGGTAGWVFGTNSVLAIVAENTVLWILAGLVGAGVLSTLLEKLCRRVLGRFLKSDVEDMMELINEEFACMIAEHALDEAQAEAIAETIQICEKVCISCFCKADKQKYVREVLVPYFSEDVCLKG